jgi:hypothetical protein
MGHFLSAAGSSLCSSTTDVGMHVVKALVGQTAWQTFDEWMQQASLLSVHYSCPQKPLRAWAKTLKGNVLGLSAYRFGGPFCSRCAAGELCPGGGRLSPLVCPANSIAPANATAVQQCVCKAGYGRPANSSLGCTTCPICEACPVGSYSTGGSTDSCTPCGRGRTTSAVGSTGATACVCAPG